jgi:periplasmic divalent cation tolerance protein
MVSTTTDSREAALDLIRSAVRAKLAASAQVIGPVTSVFWHQGSYGEGEEWQVWLRTTADRYAELEAHLIDHHPWQNPEIAAVSLSAGSAPYLAWIDQATASGT